MTSPCMIRRDLEGNCHFCLDISQIPTGLMDFLLHIANRRHFLFPPLLGATGGTEEQNDPRSGTAKRCPSGVGAAGQGCSAVGWMGVRRGRGHIKLQKTL